MARTETRGYRLPHGQHSLLADMHSCIRNYSDFADWIRPRLEEFRQMAEARRAAETLARLPAEAVIHCLENIVNGPIAEQLARALHQAAQAANDDDGPTCSNAPSSCEAALTVTAADHGATASSPEADLQPSPPQSPTSAASEPTGHADAGDDCFAGPSNLEGIELKAMEVAAALSPRPTGLARRLLKAEVLQADGSRRPLVRKEIERIVVRALSVSEVSARSAAQRAISDDPDRDARLSRKAPIARALSDDHIAAIHAAKNQGLSRQAIAEKMGCDVRTVRIALSRDAATSVVAPIAWQRRRPSLEAACALGFDAYAIGSDRHWTWLLARGGRLEKLGTAHVLERAKEAANKAMRAAARSRGSGESDPRSPPLFNGVAWRAEQDDRFEVRFSARDDDYLLSSCWTGDQWDWVVRRDDGAAAEPEFVAAGQAATFQSAGIRATEAVRADRL